MRAVWRCLLSIALLGSGGLAAGAPPAPARQIAVLYPEVGEPERSVFARMIDGVREKVGGGLLVIAIGDGPRQQDISEELHRQDVGVAIAIGRSALRVAARLDDDIGVIVGGTVPLAESERRSFNDFSLATEPAMLLQRLQTFMPAVRRVFVVYDRHQNAWLLRLATSAARARGIELVAYEASELKTALRHYRAILSGMDASADALWLPPDSTTVHEASVLPLVLQEAWRRKLTVFSSSLGHARRGALFAVYPDDLEVGRQLADYALNYLSSGGHYLRPVSPLKSARLAVNRRTAAHLSVDAAGQDLPVDRVFPEH